MKAEVTTVYCSRRELLSDKRTYLSHLIRHLVHGHNHNQFQMPRSNEH